MLSFKPLWLIVLCEDDDARPGFELWQREMEDMVITHNILLCRLSRDTFLSFPQILEHVQPHIQGIFELIGIMTTLDFINGDKETLRNLVQHVQTLQTQASMVMGVILPPRSTVIRVRHYLEVEFETLV